MLRIVAFILLAIFACPGPCCDPHQGRGLGPGRSRQPADRLWARHGPSGNGRYAAQFAVHRAVPAIDAGPHGRQRPRSQPADAQCRGGDRDGRPSSLRRSRIAHRRDRHIDGRCDLPEGRHPDAHCSAGRRRAGLCGRAGCDRRVRILRAGTGRDPDVGRRDRGTDPERRPHRARGPGRVQCRGPWPSSSRTPITRRRR